MYRYIKHEWTKYYNLKTKPGGSFVICCFSLTDFNIFCLCGGLVAKLCLTLVTPWTVAWWAPLYMEFSRNTGVGCHFLLQDIFLTQESNPGLLHCRQILY